MSPCWSITTINVALNTADLDILEKARKNELGVTVRRYGDVFQFHHSSQRTPVTIRNGRVEVERGNESFAAQINVAYSRQVVREVASRFRWQAKETKANVFEMNRRF